MGFGNGSTVSYSAFFLGFRFHISCYLWSGQSDKKKKRAQGIVYLKKKHDNLTIHFTTTQKGKLDDQFDQNPRPCVLTIIHKNLKQQFSLPVLIINHLSVK